MIFTALRSTHAQRLIALIVGFVWLSQAGVYSAVVAAAESFTGTHRVHVDWSDTHATVVLHHLENSPTTHHHGVVDKMLLLTAADGAHPDHCLEAEMFQSISSDLHKNVRRVDTVTLLTLPSVTLVLQEATSDPARWIMTAERARCPRSLDPLGTICLLV